MMDADFILLLNHLVADDEKWLHHYDAVRKTRKHARSCAS